MYNSEHKWIFSYPNPLYCTVKSTYQTVCQHAAFDTHFAYSIIGLTLKNKPAAHLDGKLWYEGVVGRGGGGNAQLLLLARVAEHLVVPVPVDVGRWARHVLYTAFQVYAAALLHEELSGPGNPRSRLYTKTTFMSNQNAEFRDQTS